MRKAFTTPPGTCWRPKTTKAKISQGRSGRRLDVLGALSALAVAGQRAQRLAGESTSIDRLPELLITWVRHVTGLHGFSPPEVLSDGLRLLQDSDGRLPISEVARTLGVGTRRLHRQFVSNVGLPPKAYARVLRFQRAVRLLRAHVPLAAVAGEAGYADQAHMTREFLRHTGYTPTRLPPVSLVTLAAL